jgi:hypothetical protein
VPYLRWLLGNFSLRRPEFDPRLGNVGFVVNRVAMGRVFFEYFGFPCQFSFHRLLHIHHHLSSWAGTIGQLVADVPSGPSLTLLQEKINNYEQPTRFGSAFLLCDVDLSSPQYKYCFRQILWYFLSKGQITSGILFWVELMPCSLVEGDQRF